MEGERVFLAGLPGGDEVHRYKKSLVVLFHGKRKTLCTGPHNGGYRENLTAVFNNDCTTGAGMAAELRAPTYAEHIALLASELGLDSGNAAGISTAAQMENISIVTETHGALHVTALVTGDVEVNGGRAGDPASWDEIHEREAGHEVHGTINIILHIGVNLTEGALTRALVTCTEAKTAALQELLAPSRYSSGLATGSGTDGTIIIANAESKWTLNNSGKHSKLGELIGKSVKTAVKEALRLQTGLSPEKQHNVLKRVDRYGITEDSLWALYLTQHDEKSGALINRAEFANRVYRLFRGGSIVSYVSLYVHLLDQLSWGLLHPEDTARAAKELLLLAGLSLPEKLFRTPANEETEYLPALISVLEIFLADFIALNTGGDLK
ncbi:MAG: adenosylcobinamide amidohydrolase [Treponema sp.]|jgi:adenosylcobinamide amidohydrolase|nr:adenosylcobinamide amidohydrolase [Treponema sp.]